MKGAEFCDAGVRFFEITRNISHPFNLVFVFCVAILLAAAVQASPVSVDEIGEEVVNNEIAAEPQELSIAEETVVEEAAPEEEAKIEEVEDVKNEVLEDETTFHLINEHSEDEVAVPYDGEGDESLSGESFLDDETDTEEEMTQDEKERIIGIEIPLCAQHTDDRVALHLR